MFGTVMGTVSLSDTVNLHPNMTHQLHRKMYRQTRRKYTYPKEMLSTGRIRAGCKYMVLLDQSSVQINKVALYGTFAVAAFNALWPGKQERSDA